ncbi:TM2 domain-containing protein [Thiovibrio sp. JS02]
MPQTQTSPKSRLACLLLCLFLGALGVHRFYVGKTGTGILMLLSLGGIGIWTLIDLVMIIVGSFKDKEGRVVFRWAEPGSI